MPQKLTLETALSGEAPRVSQIRRQNAEAAQAQPQYLAQGHAPGQHYNQRYNPTQQYAGPPTRGGYQRAGFDHYQAGGRGGYQARGGPSRGGGGGGRNSVPEWAREEYAPPGIGGGGRGAGGFDQQGGYRGPTGAGYGDSDAGFYDQPVGQQPPSGYGGGGSRGRGRGRGRGRDSYNGAGGGGGGGGGYYDSFAGGYGAPPSGRGVGGEIEFDTFAGQDRY